MSERQRGQARNRRRERDRAKDSERWRETAKEREAERRMQRGMARKKQTDGEGAMEGKRGVKIFSVSPLKCIAREIRKIS